MTRTGQLILDGDGHVSERVALIVRHRPGDCPRGWLTGDVTGRGQADKCREDAGCGRNARNRMCHGVA